MQKRKKWKKKKKICMALFTGVIFSGLVWTSRQQVCSLAKNAGTTLVEHGIFQIMYESVGNKKYYSDEMPENSTLNIEKITGNEEKMQMYYKQKWTADDKETLERMEEENKKVVEATNDFVTKKKGEITKNKKKDEKQTTKNTLVKQLKSSLDTEFLLENFYIVDSTTSVDKKVFDVEKMLDKDFSIKKQKEPQILIYHTHSQEGYIDSNPQDASTTIMGVGEYLCAILREEYGFNVIHHLGMYDVESRDDAYAKAAVGLEEVLAQNPTIEVVIDLHRDAVAEGNKLVTNIQGMDMAQFMFFNGLSYTRARGELTSLQNPYIQENLSFAFQMKLVADEYYPGLTRKTYLKGYRYNLQYRPKSLLIELGAQTNTVEEAMNACKPMAHIISMVLKGENKHGQ